MEGVWVEGVWVKGVWVDGVWRWRVCGAGGNVGGGSVRWRECEVELGFKKWIAPFRILSTLDI